MGSYACSASDSLEHLRYASNANLKLNFSSSPQSTINRSSVLSRKFKRICLVACFNSNLKEVDYI